MTKNIDQLINQIETYNKNVDQRKIKKAWKFAQKAHKGQKRLTGEDFVVHPLQVAVTLASWKLDETSIIAGLLHDTIEDSDVTYEEVAAEFGEDVALIVDGVTKVTNIRLRGSKETQFIETLRKMILVMAKDIRVVMVKLADRLHNMQTLHGLPKEKQYTNALETLEIYAPLAERLGMGQIKGTLQDLAFPYVYPDDYQKFIKESQVFYENAEKNIQKVQRNLLKNFKEAKIDVKVIGRKKHYFSLWEKLKRPLIEGDYDKINDIIAFRLIVKNVRECYEALGIVHNLYTPVPNMTLSDYIAQPKPNGYRSLHTKVFANGSGVVEIQIRTEKMHTQAEYGAAAHWMYSESKSQGAADDTLDRGDLSVDDSQKWVKQLVDWHKEISDSNKFLEAVKLDALKSRILVFSPRGDVYDLPQGATCIDYAYAVHSDLGRHIERIIVNGVIKPLDFQLSNGDIVEVKKNKRPKGPYRDWLNHSVTTRARSAIRKQLSLI